MRVKNQNGTQVIMLSFAGSFLSACHSVSSAIPVISTAASFTVAENQDVATTLSVINVGSSPALVWSLAPGIGATDNTAFVINSSTGALTFKVSPDYEIKNSYQVRVKATVNGVPTEKPLVVNVTDAATEPLLIRTATLEVPEKQSKVGTLLASNVTAGTTPTWSLKAGGTDNDSFTISGSELSFKSTVITNYESAKKNYSVKVEVVNGTGKVDKDIKVNLTNFNEAPTITSTYFSVAENQLIAGTLTAFDVDTSDTQTWSLVAGIDDTDNHSFSILNGVLTFKALPNPAEAKKSYSVRVKVEDAAGLSSTKAIAVIITNVNEAPTITGSASFSTIENQIAIPHDLVATDPEDTAIDPEDSTITWSLPTTGTGSDDNAQFNIDPKFGSLTFKTAPDYETKKSYKVLLQVTDAGGLIVTKAITVNVTNANDPGSLVVTGTATAGNTLTASLSDQDGVPASGITYKWENSTGTLLATGASNTLALTTANAANLGKSVKVIASYTDNTSFSETVTGILATPPDAIAITALTKIYAASNYAGRTSTPDASVITVTDLQAVIGAGVNSALLSQYQTVIQTKTDFTNPNSTANNAAMSTEAQILITTQSAILARLYQSATTIPDITGIDTSLATNTYQMFHFATTFNQDISNWNVSNVNNMTGMFHIAIAFNQNIGNWDVSNVKNMSDMFANATAFNQDISDWDVSKVTDMTAMFNSSGLSTTNYDKVLLGWSYRLSEL